MPAKEDLTQVERDKMEIGCDFDFRAIAKRPLESISPNEVAMYKWSGVYAQLQPGFFMIRVVTPGGRMTTTQFQRAVDLAETYGQGELCITTRQTLQFHWIRQQDIHKILEGMAEVGITTKNACGDVPRNVVGSSLAGDSPYQTGDAARIIRMLAEDNEIQNQRNLPRKHKISVACANEAGAQTLMNCQGWVPVVRDGVTGWKFHAGGGLGARPYLAKVIFDWVPEDLVLAVSRATVEAFRRYGNRRKRAFARLKVVVDEMGASAFGDRLLEIMQARGIAGVDRIEKATSPIPDIGRPILNGEPVVPQIQRDRVTVRVIIPRSELRTKSTNDILDIARQNGNGDIMFTNRQNLEIRDVPASKAEQVVAALHDAGLQTEGLDHLPDIVACVGTTMCRLAVSDTPDAYHRLHDAFADDETYWRKIGPLRVNLTGCPNNCAQAWVADIGLRGRRIRNDENGGSDESFTVFVGGKLHGAGRIAEELFDVRTEELVPAIRRILDTYLDKRQKNEIFCDFIDRVGVPAFKEMIPA
ncbi:MAG: nitrite/sulfite reductase [Kiritimatiellia bacterium]